MSAPLLGDKHIFQEHFRGQLQEIPPVGGLYQPNGLSLAAWSNNPAFLFKPHRLAPPLAF